MKEYLQKIKELKALGEKLIDSDIENIGFIEEVECIDMHLECAISILTQAMGERKG